MIRKTIIVVLTLGAILAGCLAAYLTLTPPSLNSRRLGDCYSSRYTGWILTRRGMAALSLHECGPWQGYTTELVNYGRLPLRAESQLEKVVGLRIRCGTDESGHWFFLLRMRQRFPCVAMVLLGTFPVVASLGTVRRHRRRKRGLCVKCGYNLTGLTEPR